MALVLLFLLLAGRSEAAWPNPTPTPGWYNWTNMWQLNLSYQEKVFQWPFPATNFHNHFKVLVDRPVVTNLTTGVLITNNVFGFVCITNVAIFSNFVYTSASGITSTNVAGFSYFNDGWPWYGDPSGFGYHVGSIYRWCQSHMEYYGEVSEPLMFNPKRYYFGSFSKNNWMRWWSETNEVGVYTNIYPTFAGNFWSSEAVHDRYGIGEMKWPPASGMYGLKAFYFTEDPVATQLWPLAQSSWNGTAWKFTQIRPLPRYTGKDYDTWNKVWMMTNVAPAIWYGNDTNVFGSFTNNEGAVTNAYNTLTVTVSGLRSNYEYVNYPYSFSTLPYTKTYTVNAGWNPCDWTDHWVTVSSMTFSGNPSNMHDTVVLLYTNFICTFSEIGAPDASYPGSIYEQWLHTTVRLRNTNIVERMIYNDSMRQTSTQFQLDYWPWPYQPFQALVRTKSLLDWTIVVPGDETTLETEWDTQKAAFKSDWNAVPWVETTNSSPIYRLYFYGTYWFEDWDSDTVTDHIGFTFSSERRSWKNHFDASQIACSTNYYSSGWVQWGFNGMGSNDVDGLLLWALDGWTNVEWYAESKDQIRKDFFTDPGLSSAADWKSTGTSFVGDRPDFDDAGSYSWDYAIPGIYRQLWIMNWDGTYGFKYITPTRY